MSCQRCAGGNPFRPYGNGEQPSSCPTALHAICFRSPTSSKLKGRNQTRLADDSPPGGVQLFFRIGIIPRTSSWSFGSGNFGRPICSLILPLRILQFAKTWRGTVPSSMQHWRVTLAGSNKSCLMRRTANDQKIVSIGFPSRKIWKRCDTRRGNKRPAGISNSLPGRWDY